MNKHATSIAFASVVLASIAQVADGQPVSAQGPRSSPTVGLIDPTVSTYNGNSPMRCTASSTPTTIFAEQNRAALQQAVLDASSTGKWIYLPRCTVDAVSALDCPMDDSCAYPIGRKGGGTPVTQNCGADFNGTSNVTIIGYGAQLRGFNTGASDFAILCIRGTSNVRVIGLHLSMRDNTSTSEQTHHLKIGDGLATSVDNVEVVDVVFHEGKPLDVVHHGDCVFVNGNVGALVRRVSFVRNTFHECNRSGIAFQSGHQFANVVDSTFVSTRNSDIDNEGTHPAPIEYTSVIGNHFSHVGQSSAISMSGFFPAYPQLGMIVAENTSTGGRIEGIGVTQAQVRDNIVTLTEAADPNSAIFIESELADSWFVGNHATRGAATARNDVIHIALHGNCVTQTPSAPLCYPAGVWIRGNRVEQLADIATTDNDSGSGIRIRRGNPMWVTGNDVLYAGATSSTSVKGFSGIYGEFNSTDTNEWMSEWVSGNTLRTTGGQPLALWAQQIQAQTPAKLGVNWLRDNQVYGARALYDLSLTSSPETYPDGIPPIISGNALVSTAKTGSNDAKRWISALRPPPERLVAAGALSPSNDSTIVGDCGADSDTLADGARDGFIKTVLLTSSCTSTGTLTPTHFGDGTSISWALDATTPNASFRLVWDQTSTTWRLLDVSAALTVNP
jgi:hypothetical protein